MATIRKRKRLLDAYRFAGFRPLELVRGVFGDSSARIITLVRRSKKRSAKGVAGHTRSGTTARHGASTICPAATRGSIRCRASTIKDVAEELNLDWQTVKELDKQYMTAQLERAGTPAPKAIGIDPRFREGRLSIRKGHTYRIVVSDLIRRRPIWFGGDGRSEDSMRQFYDWLGEKKARGIRLAVMDMWKPFRNVTNERAPQAAILFDKFHIMKHLGEAMDKVRKME